jgi:hypothetical protein
MDSGCDSKGMFDDFNEESRNSIKWNGRMPLITYTLQQQHFRRRIPVRTQRSAKTSLPVTYTALKWRCFAATAKQIINTIKFKP